MFRIFLLAITLLSLSLQAEPYKIPRPKIEYQFEEFEEVRDIWNLPSLVNQKWRIWPQVIAQPSYVYIHAEEGWVVSRVDLVCYNRWRTELATEMVCTRINKEEREYRAAVGDWDQIEKSAYESFQDNSLVTWEGMEISIPYNSELGPNNFYVYLRVTYVKENSPESRYEP